MKKDLKILRDEVIAGLILFALVLGVMSPVILYLAVLKYAVKYLLFG